LVVDAVATQLHVDPAAIGVPPEFVAPGRRVEFDAKRRRLFVGHSQGATVGPARAGRGQPDPRRVLASRCSRNVGKTIRAIDESAMAALRVYPWPGNIRELQNVVERAVILARGNVLGLPDFELPSLGSEPLPARPDGPRDERQQIEEALRAGR